MYRREEVARYLYWGPRTRDQSIEKLEQVKRLTSFDTEGHAIRLAAVLPESGAVIGDISLSHVSVEHQQGEIGFVINPDHQRRGYATEACSALLRLGFEDLGLHRIAGRADPRNAGSVGVMERLGMRREAHFRESELIKGDWGDEVVYAILAAEWKARG
jgi:RimJ/RimL family protein N-acetyltransferase